MTDTEFKRELFTKLIGFCVAVEQSDMSGKSKDTYKDHAVMFTRWVLGDFHPGTMRGARGSNDIEEVRRLVP